MKRIVYGLSHHCWAPPRAALGSRPCRLRLSVGPALSFNCAGIRRYIHYRNPLTYTKQQVSTKVHALRPGSNETEAGEGEEVGGMRRREE